MQLLLAAGYIVTAITTFVPLHNCNECWSRGLRI